MAVHPMPSGPVDHKPIPMRKGWHAPFDVLRGRKGHWWQLGSWFLLSILVVRIILPYVLLAAINSGLHTDHAISGKVGDLTLGIVPGNIVLHHIILNQQDDSGEIERVVAVQESRAHLSWGALIVGKLVGSLHLKDLTLYVRPSASVKPGEHKAWDEHTWRSALAGLVPMRITEITIENGAIEFDDHARKVHTNIWDINGKIMDLGLPATDHRPALYSFTASTPGDGRLTVEGTALISQEKPHATLKALLKDVDLPKLNPLIVSYEGIGFTSGIFVGSVEATLDGQDLIGEAKPIFKHLQLKSFRDATDGASTKLFWSIVVPVAAWVLKNTEEDQQAARIPIKGRVDDPHTDMWTIFTSALANAFVTALVPGFEGLGQSWVTAAKPE